MGFMDKLRGNPQPAPAIRPSSDPGRKDLVDNELLLSLSRRNVDDRFREFWMPLVGPVEPRIEGFIQAGLLRKGTLADKIGEAYRVKDLKPMLEARGLTPKGNKPDLVEMLVNSGDTQELDAELCGITCYRATETGRARIDTFQQWKKSERLAAQSQILAHLQSGDFKNGIKSARAFGSRQLLDASPGDQRWRSWAGDQQALDAKLVYSLSYEDLAVTPEQRRDVASQIALFFLMPGYDPTSAVLEACGGLIPCADLARFLAEDPCRTGKSADLFSPDDMADIYISTKRAQAWAEREMRQIMSDRIGKGIEILLMQGYSCPICKPGKHKFRWSELAQMPKLPQHWGCMCSYLPWV